MIEIIERVESRDGEAWAELQRERWTTRGGYELEQWRVVHVWAWPTRPGGNCHHASEHDAEATARERYAEAAACVIGYDEAASL